MKKIVLFIIVGFTALFAETPTPTASDSTESTSLSESTDSALPEGFETKRQENIRKQIQYSDEEDLKGIEADEENGIDPNMFVTTSTGTSIYNYTLDAGAQFGMYNELLLWHASLSIILWRGVAELNIPITYQLVGSDLKEDFSDPSHLFISTALKYRKWVANEDDGLFYGAGMRMHYIKLKYNVVKQNGNKKIEKSPTGFVVFTPQLEIGWDYSFSRHFGFRPSLELGYSLSASNQYEQASDIDDTISFLDNSFHWNILLPFSFSF